jgi:membrane protein required for colicin V production
MFTNLDYIILIIVIFFILASVFKGFLNELISLVVLTISVLSSYYIGAEFKDLLGFMIPWEFVNAILAFGLTFLFTLLLAQKLFKYLFDKVSINPSLDALLGVIFGILKSVLVVAIFFIIVDSIIPENEQPDFIKNSYIKKYYYVVKDTMFAKDSIINQGIKIKEF